MSDSRTWASDRGYSIVEMLVTMLIVGVAGGIGLAAATMGADATNRAEDRVEVLAELQATVERVGRELRAADPVVLDTSQDSATHVGATVFRGGERHEYVWRVDTSTGTPQLVQDQTTYSPSSAVIASGPTETRVLVEELPAATDPVFTYFDEDGNAVTPGAGAGQRVARIRMTLERPDTEGEIVDLATDVSVRSIRRQ